MRDPTQPVSSLRQLGLEEQVAQRGLRVEVAGVVKQRAVEGERDDRAQPLAHGVAKP